MSMTCNVELLWTRRCDVSHKHNMRTPPKTNPITPEPSTSIAVIAAKLSSAALRLLAKKMWKSTIADPSFSSDSPPIIMDSAGDAPKEFSNASTATGSVAESTAPKARPSGHVNP